MRTLNSDWWETYAPHLIHVLRRAVTLSFILSCNFISLGSIIGWSSPGSSGELNMVNDEWWALQAVCQGVKQKRWKCGGDCYNGPYPYTNLPSAALCWNMVSYICRNNSQHGVLGVTSRSCLAGHLLSRWSSSLQHVHPPECLSFAYWRLWFNLWLIRIILMILWRQKRYFRVCYFLENDKNHPALYPVNALYIL